MKTVFKAMFWIGQHHLKQILMADYIRMKDEASFEIQNGFESP